ncbi:MAG TPA: riboflavin synthase [Actinomycetota bacterium]|jgi:riboflavin synthase|nr:riboflavin synthase [Actinomycetota bacterium]
MFSGIVEERGAVGVVEPHRLVVRCRTVLEDSDLGASVAVNGVCLTVVERTADTLTFDVSEETRSRTSLARLSPNDPVNLERPVTLMTRLGGHLVQGHVDGVGRVVSLERDELGGALVRVRPPAELLRYLVEKGSVAVDGVSLTVAGPPDEAFSVALIPHTLAVTTLGTAAVGDPVNLEVDVMAKYVERLLKATDQGRGTTEGMVDR